MTAKKRDCIKIIKTPIVIDLSEICMMYNFCCFVFNKYFFYVKSNVQITYPNQFVGPCFFLTVEQSNDSSSIVV